MLLEKQAPELLNPGRAIRGRSLWTRGFSLIESVATIAVVGVLASVVVNLAGGAPSAVSQAKLQSDVVMLNQLVGIYLADGGTLNGISSPQVVLDSLKRARPSAGMQQYTGPASGKLVDVRLRARMGSGSLTRGMSGRVVWNSAGKRFEVTQGAVSGVDEFYLDEALAATDYGTSARSTQAVSFNSSKGWVWGSTTDGGGGAPKEPTYVDPAGTEKYFDPTESAFPSSSSGGGSSGGGSGSGSGGSGGSGSGGGMSPASLPAPIVSPDGGSFPAAAFPSTVTISANGAPGGQSKLVYQQNNAAWQDYAGPIPVVTGDTIEAQNVTLNPSAYSSGPVVAESYYRLVSGITGSGTGSWANITGGGNLMQSTTSDGDTITLTHGNTQLDLGNGQYLDAGVQNEVSFTQNSFSDIDPNTWFKLGELSMLNGTTFYNSEATGATLRLDFNLSNPAAASSVDINLGFISNENSSDRLASADVVELKNPTTSTVFDFGGVSYRLELMWVNLDPGAGTVQGSQFLIYEGASAHAELSARFVPDR